jgi:HTH-type transcriptional regulator/antitoxin HipB
MIIHSLDDLSKLVRQKRKEQKLTQTDLAGVTGVGVRFIVDLENAKETAQIGKVLRVMKILGIKLEAR